MCVSELSLRSGFNSHFNHGLFAVMVKQLNTTEAQMTSVNLGDDAVPCSRDVTVSRIYCL